MESGRDAVHVVDMVRGCRADTRHGLEAAASGDRVTHQQRAGIGRPA